MTFDSLITAYLDCRRHKRSAAEALAFEADWERNLLALHGSLNEGSFHPGPASAFVVHTPVQREVFAASFGERIVHHWLIARNCTLKCDRSEWTGLPRDKSLFYVPPGRGLPIGNLTSQWFGNFYLTPFDRFVTQTLGVKYYGRYVDDFVVVHPDKESLKGLIPQLERFLKEELGMTLHPRKRSLQEACKGVRFLGMVIRSDGSLHVGKRTKTGMYAAIRRWNDVARERLLSAQEIRQFCASLNSYWGLMRHCNSYRLRKRSVAALAPAIREQIIVCDYKKIIVKQVKHNKYENKDE